MTRAADDPQKPRERLSLEALDRTCPDRCPHFGRLRLVDGERRQDYKSFQLCLLPAMTYESLKMGSGDRY